MTHQTTRWAILKLLGLVYSAAFWVAWKQNVGLMGHHGIVPVYNNDNGDSILDRFQQGYAPDTSPWEHFTRHPTLFWWIPLNDDNMQAVALSGMLLSLLTMTGLYVSWLSLLLLWLLYFSIVTVAEGTSFYGYGWESQLLETGSLAIFLCDLPSLQLRPLLRVRLGLFQQRAPSGPPSRIVLWLYAWLSFRISLGAGLIKVRGSSCWTDKTCLWYHFETQPIPSPLSFIFHFLPRGVLSRAVDMDLFVQLYTSWMVLVVGGHPLLVALRRIGGIVQAGFMINIMLSGNFSFLNHLTIIPALACLDDACWPAWMVRWIVPKSASSVRKSKAATQSGVSASSGNGISLPPRILADVMLLGVILYKSQPVIHNLLGTSGRHQQMNASFDPLRLVNTYGAFGSVGKKRYEPIVSISVDGNEWRELEFPCKPGSLTRRPCFCAPVHKRLDWNVWFLGFKPHKAMLNRRESWLYRFIEKLLEYETCKEDEENATMDGINGEQTSCAANNTDEEIRATRPWLALLDASSADYLIDLYQREIRLKYAKVDMYHYQMAASLSSILAEYSRQALQQQRPWHQIEVSWWNRTFDEVLLPSLAWKPGTKLYWAKDL